jgi:dTDP-4-amino-4,6-dideoxygalactose transaminase
MSVEEQSLAVLGGAPAFATPLHVGRPNIGDRDAFLARLADILDRRWLSNHGRYVMELETRIADMLGVKHCVSTCNGTVALEVAARAAGLTGEVIVPSFTFVATAHALQWLGVTPVFCDILPDRHTIDPARVEELITPRTTGILGVHVWGRPCEIEALIEIADRHGLRLLFDAAHAFTCTHRGMPIGNFGDAEILSFHATKFFNTFEGGAIVTNDDELGRRARLMADFGFGDGDTPESIGTNGKLSEVHAAMGLTGLEAVDHVVAVNRRNHARYVEQLEDVEGLLAHRFDPLERHNWQYVVVEVDEERFGISRDRLVQVLHAENVLARRYFHPGCHQMEPYRTSSPDAAQRLPQTERLVERVLTLPTGTALNVDEIDVVCGLIRQAHDQADAIDLALRGR